MPLLIRGLLEPDGITTIGPDTTYVISGPGSAGYFRYPGQTWDTIVITSRELSLPNRDFAKMVAEAPRSQLAEFVEKGFVSVWDTTASAFLTGDQIRNYS